ncbi:MAG TPA: SCO family protein [Fimbriimonadaceae bacterium]
MSILSLRSVTRLLLTALAACCCLTANAQNFEGTLPVQSQNDPSLNVRVEQKLGNAIPLDTQFKDQTGASVTFGSLLNNKPTVVLPIFYRCKGVCSIETQDLIGTLAQMKQHVGQDFEVIFLSIDPQEGPALALDKFKTTLASSPNFKGTDVGWHFLTGTIDNIHRVTDALGFFFNYDAASDVVNHPSGLMFLSPDGKVSSYILAISYTPDQLSKNIDIAGANRVGEKSTDSFFGCIHTDPLTGKRSIVIQKFVSLAGLLTVIALVATIAALSIRSKRKAA